MTVHPLARRVIEAIESWDPVRDPLRWSDERFDTLALEVFAHQYAHNEAYRRFCEATGASPATVTSSRAIPAVPTDAFKHVRLFAAPGAEETGEGGGVVRIFRTSGTTLGAGTAPARGEHHFGTLEVYRASLHRPFQRFCNPSGARLRMLVIAPSGEDLVDSSLSFMLSEVVGRWGDAKSAFFVTAGERGLTFDFDGLIAALEEAERDGVATMVLGTAFGFIELFDHTERSFRLPPGSRVMETGGFKGRTREVSREELYGAFTTRLGVAPEYCVSEYSMTELSSQSYGDSLWRAHQAGGDEEGEAPVRLRLPPWARVEIVDPLSLEPYGEPGRRGLIRWIDLANVDSVCAVQTSDMGVADADGGFVLLGRAPDAELRGCSLTIEELLEANRS